MKLTKEMIESHNPCSDGLEWYLRNGSSDLLKTLIDVNEYKPEWARWLYTRLMNLQQKREIAIFAAEQVLPIFEKKYPEDDRPRKAIEAAKLFLANDTPENRKAADAAYAAAYAAADAADAAYAAAAAADAAAAAYAAAAAADAAYAARKEMQIKIIKEAVRILEEGKNEPRRKD